MPFKRFLKEMPFKGCLNFEVELILKDIFLLLSFLRFFRENIEQLFSSNRFGSWKKIKKGKKSFNGGSSKMKKEKKEWNYFFAFDIGAF